MKILNIAWLFEKMKRCVGIVEDGDTASQNIASGKLVVWKGLPKKANQAISSGDALSSTNLDDVSEGFANLLNSNLAYKLAGSKTGTDEVTLPNDWKELIIQTQYSSYTMTAKFLRQMVTANYKSVGLGSFGTSFSIGQLSLSQAKLTLVEWSGSAVTSSSEIYVYYR